VEHLEFVVEFKDGKRDWIDPVDIDCVDIADGLIVVTANTGYVYKYTESDVSKWVVRLYGEETTYDPIE
jgi:hypothetical protein